jgi:hypothetical protein
MVIPLESPHDNDISSILLFEGSGLFSVMSTKLFALLLGDEKLERAFRRAGSNPFVEARFACLSLAVDAFRCADLQGARHPLCLARQLRHAQCAASRVAPEALDRLHACRRAQGEQHQQCEELEGDVLRLVAQRTKQHADAIVFSNEERKGVLSCGVPEHARSAAEFVARLDCLAPFVCKTAWTDLQNCFQTENNVSGSCFDVAVELMTCMGRENSRTMFKQL